MSAGNWWAERMRIDRRPSTFYAPAAVFTAYVLFLYGPMACIYILSFQERQGALVAPRKGKALVAPRKRK